MRCRLEFVLGVVICLLLTPIDSHAAEGREDCKTSLALITASIVGVVGAGLLYDASQDSGLPPRGEHLPFTEPEHLYQEDPRFCLPDGGVNACVPTSHAMLINWLAGHGHPDLFPREVAKEDREAWLVRTLSSAMRPNGYEGVAPPREKGAVLKFLQGRKYAKASVSYHGWQVWEKNFQLAAFDSKPLFDALRQGKPATLHLWYFRSGANHEVVATGYRRGNDFGRDRLEIFVLDPGDRSGISVPLRFREISQEEAAEVDPSLMPGNSVLIHPWNGKTAVLKGYMILDIGTPSPVRAQ